MGSAMGGTVSARQNGVVAANVAGLINHHFRDVDRVNGREVHHSNEMIVPELTHLNTSWVNDGRGGFKDCESTDEVRDYMNKRLSGVKLKTRTRKDGTTYEVATRKDFPVVRDWVLQLDPDAMQHYRELMEAHRAAVEDDDQATADRLQQAIDDERDQIRRYLGVMVDKVTDEVGQANVIGGSMHWDETNPHVQLLTLPIDAKNELNWKGFRLGYPDGLVAFHDDIRSALRDAGYQAFDERVGGAAKHLQLAEYKQMKDALRSAYGVIDNGDEVTKLVEEVKQLRADVKRLPDLEEREAAAAEHEETLVFRSAQLDERSAQLDVRSADVDKRETSVNAAAAALERARSAQQAELEAEAERIKAEAVEEAAKIKRQALRDTLPLRSEAREARDAARSYLERARNAVEASESLLEQVSSTVTRQHLQEAADDVQQRYGDLLGGVGHDEGKHYGG